MHSSQKAKKRKKKGKKESTNSAGNDKIIYFHSQILNVILAAGRAYTVSVALPGSIIENAQSAELRTYLAGQVARALVIYSVDEVIVFDEHSPST